MELKVFSLVVIVLCVQTFNTASSISMKQLRERTDILELRIENRFDYEQSQRHKDFESIMTKFSEITTRMDKWEEKLSLPDDTKMDKTKHTVGVSEDIDLKQHDMFKYLIQGLQEEKTRVRKMMGEILRLGKEIHEAQTRKENDDSLIDSVLDKSNSELKEQLNNLNQSLVKRIETMMTESIAAGKTLSEDLKSSIQKMCNVENTKTMIETTIKQLFMDIYPSSVTNISTVSESSICSCSETNISPSSENRRTTQASITSCKDGLSNGYQMDGVYTINGIDKYCDQTTDGGGWTVFQRRINGVVDFDRDWNSYKHGFGNISGEFWLGNDYLSGKHNLGYHELRIDMEDFEGNRAYAKYDRFRIDPESNNYTLHIGGYSGNVSNTFRFHNGYKFSTKDVDLHEWEDGSCAQKHSGGWWYRDNICSFANLNGKYHLNRGYKDGAYWSGWKGGSPLKFVEMKFR